MYRILGADQKEYGPVTVEQLRQWVAEGRANAQTLVQGANSTEWKPLGMLPELAGFVPAPVAPPAHGMAGAQGGVSNYLWQSIAVTACCCLPVGIPAIIFSAQVNSKLAAGDIPGATEASRKALIFCWVALGLGLVGDGIFLMLAMFDALDGLKF